MEDKSKEERSDQLEGKAESKGEATSVDDKKLNEEKKKKSEGKEKEKKSKKSKDSKKKKKKNKSRSRSRSRSSKRHSKKRRSKSRSDSKRRKKKHGKSRKRKSYSSSSRSSSKSRERKRSRTKSIKKSKSKSRDRKNWRFDSPPKTAMETVAAASAGLIPQQESTTNPVQSLLGNSLPSLGLGGISLPGLSGLKDLPSSELLKLQLLQSTQASKSDRKLYVGNLPPNLTPQTLMDVLNSALVKMNVNTNPPGNSIVTAWISADGHYGFVEFRTPEETTNGFALNNVAIFGQPLKVGRPKNYVASTTLPTNLLLQGGLLNSLNPISNLVNMSLGGAAVAPTIPINNVVKVQPPSRILVLKNIVQIHELEIDEEYIEIKEDVKEQCSIHGRVLQVKIPRPIPGENVPGLGKIFVEFSTVDESKEARKNLTGMTFSNHKVECSYHDEAMFAANNFNDPS